MKHFIVVSVKFHKENDRWVAVCLELGTAIQADTLDEARDIIASAIEVHLNSLEEEGARRSFFKEHGIKVYSTPQRQIPQVVPLEANTLFEPHQIPITC